MSVRDHPISAVIAVSDMDRAAEFYEGKLGLSPEPTDEPGDERRYVCGGDTAMYVYRSPDHAGKATATMAAWEVDDVERVVDELTAAGIAFEQYEEPIKTDEKGINTTGDDRAAWFRDPDGTTFAIIG